MKEALLQFQILFWIGDALCESGRRGSQRKIVFGGDQRDIPAGARATGGCYYGDQRAELRGDFTQPGLVDDLEPVGFAKSMKRGPANESVQVAVVGSIWGFGDKTDGTMIDCIQFIEQGIGGYFVNDIAEVEDWQGCSVL